MPCRGKGKTHWRRQESIIKGIEVWPEWFLWVIKNLIWLEIIDMQWEDLTEWHLGMVDANFCACLCCHFSCVWLCDLVNCKISEAPIKMVNVQSFWVWEWNSQICELLRLLVPIRWIIVERLGSMRKQS